MNVQWSSLFGMFGALRQFTLENGIFNQAGAEQLLGNVILSSPLKKFALKKCQISDECLRGVFDALEQPGCQVEKLCFDNCNLKSVHSTDFLEPMLRKNKTIKSLLIRQVTFGEFVVLQ